MPEQLNEVAAYLLALTKAAGGTIEPADTTAAVSQPSPQLQAFLDAIPFANDGDVITADHHNTIRQALAAIARSLDETQLARAVTSSFTPVLLPDADAPAWRTGLGFAFGPASPGSCEGWMQLDLPNGTLIDALVVRGKLPQLANDWNVSLRRLELTSELRVDVCKGTIPERTGSAASFEFSVPVTTEGVTPVQLTERRRIDNTRYRYLFHSELTSQNGPDLRQYELRLIQVKCIRG